MTRPTTPMTQRSEMDLALTASCPHCGNGRLFDGFLTVAKGCRSCGLDYDFADAGDGPAVFVMMLVGFVIVGLALIVEMRFHPPLWLHLVLWIPLAIGAALAVLRPMKALLIVTQYRTKAAQGRLDRP